MQNLAAKTVVITGAGSGIGRARACKFAQKGAFLALCDVDERGLEETLGEVARLGGRARHFVVDVSDRSAMYRFADAVVDAFGAVDIVINNAGVTVSEFVEELSYDDFEWVMNINFWGVVYGTKAFLPHLKQSEESYVVNISSLFGLVSFPTQGAYNASKFAVRGFTEALRYELSDTTVTPICVHPGGIDTNIVRNARFYKDSEGLTDHNQAIKEFGKLAKTSPDEAADQIIETVMKGRKRLLIGSDAKLFDFVQRIIPNHYDKLVSFLLKQKVL